MSNTTPDEMEDDAAMKKELEAELEHSHPEESEPNDPFATDGLGNNPAKEIFEGHQE